MKTGYCGLWINLVLCLLMGCTNRSTDSIWPVPRSLGKELAAWKPPEQPTEVPHVVPEIKEPAGLLTLQQALALALMKNPSLASFGWEVRAKEAQTLQASLPPNPELSIEIEDIRLKSRDTKTRSRTITIAPEGAVEVEQATQSESGPETGLHGAQYTVALSQVIEMGGKRIRRKAVAAHDQLLAGWDYETARLDILTEVTKGYIDVVAAQQRVALTKDSVKLAEQSLDAVTERVRAGRIAPMEESKARVALATQQLELKKAQRKLSANQYRLAGMWAAVRPCFTQAAGDLYEIKPIPSEQRVLALISENPDLARWADEMDQRLAAVELEKAKRVPDLTLSGGYRYIGAEDTSALVVGVASPLPVYDRNQGGIREAKNRYAKALADREAARARIQASLAEAYQELSSSYIEVNTLRQEVLPQAHNAYEASVEGVRSGKFGYLEVLDAQRTLYELQGRYIDALVIYHKARADVERLIGTPIISLNNEPAKERK